MESYCGSQFWDMNQTWRTTDPDFTGCFQKTLLVWLPCWFLWLLAPIEIYWLVRSKEDRIPWGWLSVLRMTLLSIMVMIAITDFFLAILRHLEGRYPPSADFYNPMFKEMTLVLAGILLVAEKQRGICTSGIMFCYWLLLWACETILFRSMVKRAFHSDEEDLQLPVYMVVTSIIFYISSCCQLILFCFADVSKLVRFTHKVQKHHPEETASFLSLITFSWFDRMVWTGFRRPLVENDLWKMREPHQTAHVCKNFESQWRKKANEQKSSKRPALLSDTTLQIGHTEKPAKNGVISNQEYEALTDTSVEISLTKTLRSEFGPIFLYVTFLKIIGHGLAFAAPLLLQRLIEFVISDEPQWHGFLYAGTLFTCAFFSSIFINQGTATIMRMSLQLRSALISAIYKKALTISTSARRTTAVGEIVNLMAVDTERIAEMILETPVIFTAPLQIALAVGLLWRLLGVAVLAGLSMLLVVMPCNILIGIRMEKYHTLLMGCKDERVKMMNEVLNGIKVLKLYAWEKSFHSLISSIRKQELNAIKKNVLLMACMTFTYVLCPFLIALGMFTTYILMDSSHVLDAGKAFSAIALIAIIKEPMLMGPAILGYMVQMRVCIERIGKFLNSKDVDESQVSHIDNQDDNVVNVQKADFTWDLDIPPTLKSINFKIQRGSLIAVVGPVGSGKSSLVSAMLGEMEILNGTVNTIGKVAYVPQQAWIKNATLRDNILFTKPFDERRYNRILETCALKPDLAILPAGDKTEIGEKGINLSGGQKQRVSLARAAYSNSDLYFLDDPLSALDSHVGRHIFDKVIGPKGILKNKTRILVTHGLAFLPDTDAVIVLQEGSIAETGTYAELMKRGQAFSEFVKNYHQHEDEEEIEDDFIVDDQIRAPSASFKKRATLRRNVTSALSVSSEEGSVKGRIRRVTLNRQSLTLADEQIPDGKLIEAESVETAKVSWAVYGYYLRSVGYARFLLFALLYMSSTAMGTSTNFWLSRWSTDPPGDNRKRDMRLGIYALFGVSEAVFSFIGYIVAGFFLLRAAGILHDDMLLNILKSPMSFFDTTPLGRILNRFSKDIETIDNTLLMNVLWCMNMLCELIGILVMISIGTPIMVAVIVPLILVYFVTQKLFISTSRQLKRLESITRSPIYSHFSETLSGISTIRAFQLQQVFVNDSFDKVDVNQSSMYPNFAAKCWLALRLDLIGSVIVLCSSVFAVVQREELDPGTLGLAVSYSLTVTFALNWTAKIMGDLETQIVSVERIKEYTETPTEAEWEIPSNKPHPAWPKNGNITFEKYATRYRAGLDLVLKGLRCSIKGGERIGIVGRTGAGKSSLTLALFRLIESASGRILMDGIDIRKLGLHDLRSRLTIIPQDPVLFCGSLRLNLDPFEAYSDSEVWHALEHAHLKEFVSSLNEGLQHQISEGGENLSVGQRQLVCLARALLRKTKILILDEATAAVDLKTDDLIQTTIRKEFSDCTILTIAHRLNTIMDSTRILVLHNGAIKEFDSPANLLNNEKSEFYSMAKDAGLV